jgi:MFS family permease
MVSTSRSPDGLAPDGSAPDAAVGSNPDRYKWIALTNTTVGVMLVMIDSSIVLIAMPAIFRGIHLDPLAASNSFYLLWMMLGYLVVTSVLVVSFGRLGDMYGRVKLYNLGFLIFTIASILLSVDWMNGRAGATYLIGFRVVQGIGGAFIAANSGAILTDAFPATQRGFALGINNVSSIAGRFLGLVVGGLLATISWRLVFFVSVPFGIFGTVWAYLKLEERGIRKPAPIDWWGNVTFGIGLILVMVAITAGIRPYGGHVMGWTNPSVVAALAAGVILLVIFGVVETRVQNPMFDLHLFKIRAFSFGTLSSFLAALARGGLMFMLIIWLQGIWLPLHGFDFSETPLWAGIAMMPLSLGILIAGPLSGYLSDRYGPRFFATGGMIVTGMAFVLLDLLPINFVYVLFAGIIFLNGIGTGAFASPNRAAVMNSLPPQHRGAGSGMNTTFQNSAQVLSIGIFFSLMILGLSSVLSTSLVAGLRAHGVSAAVAERTAHLPPVSVLFAAFLGYNPIQHLIGPQALAQLPSSAVAQLSSRSFFPSLIASAFNSGLHEAFAFAVAACAIAAVASWSRGQRYVPELDGMVEARGEPVDRPVPSGAPAGDSATEAS